MQNKDKAATARIINCVGRVRRETCNSSDGGGGTDRVGLSFVLSRHTHRLC